MIPYTGGIIGRLSNCDISLDDVNVSKQHAKLIYNEDEKSFTIQDLGSRNGTFLFSVKLLFKHLATQNISWHFFSCRNAYQNPKRKVTSISSLTIQDSLLEEWLWFATFTVVWKHAQVVNQAKCSSVSRTTTHSMFQLPRKIWKKTQYYECPPL